jgi:hypothetical protein
MCFKDGEKPHIPPPPAPPPSLAICRDPGCQRCLTTLGETWGDIRLGPCAISADKHWGYVAGSAHPRWVAWLPTSAFIKLDERQAGPDHNVSRACAVGKVFVNPADPPGSKGTSQGFSIVASASASASSATTLPREGGGGGYVAPGGVQLVSSACPGQCLTDDGSQGGGVQLGDCSAVSPWTVQQ